MIDLMNNIGPAWAEYFGAAVVQNTLFLAIVFLVLHLLRNAPANTKVAVGSIGLIKLLLPPFLPASLSISSHETIGLLPQTVTAPLLGSSPGMESTSTISAHAGYTGIALLLALWLLCGGSYLLMTAISTVRLAWKLRDATEVDYNRLYGVRNARVRVYKTNRIGMPLCLGILPRKIFVPDTWDQWSSECRRTVIDHELAHIRRLDGIFLLFQILTQAIYFFHPMVWLLNRRLKEYREMACDDASSGFRRAARLEYSRCLIEIAESVMQSPVGCESASALLEHKHELLHRVAYQLKGEMAMSRKRLAIVLAALSVIALPLSWYYSEATPADSSVGSTGTSLALASGAKPGDSSHLTVVKVSIGGENNLAINGTKTSIEHFRKVMEKTVQGNEDDVVIAMACDEDVSMGKVFKIHGLLREMGLVKMSYVTSQGKDLTLILPELDYKKKLSEVNEKHISNLQVDRGGLVVLHGKQMKTAQLQDELRKLLTLDEYMILSIHISPKATYGDYMSVLAAAKSADCQRILINQPAS